MNFILGPSLFDSGSRLQLVRLWGASVDQRHRVEIPKATESIWATWRSELDEGTREQLDGGLTWSVHENAKRPSGICIFVEKKVASAWSKHELTLDDAVDLASRPFRIFLENAASDGQFLRTLLTQDERVWFDDLVEREWLLLETAGGVTEIGKRIAWAREKEARLLRVAALFDGDAVEPPASKNESEKDFRARLHINSRKALDACKQAQLGDVDAFPHHVTRRRAIENYLPITALERWVKSVGAQERESCQKRVEALKAFPRKHEFNMKKGHGGDRRRSPAATWLPANRNTRLEEGFGADIATQFEKVGSDELKADGSFDEFRSFIHALRRRIS